MAHHIIKISEFALGEKCMKNASIGVICMIFVLFASCVSAPTQTSATDKRNSQGDSTLPTTLTSWNWRLAELRNATGTVTINRIPPADFETADLSGWFVIRFLDGQVSGMGAPNRYSGPYTAGTNQTISIGNVASTKMLSFVELAELKEHEYFGYLSQVTRWEIRSGRLELYSTDENRAERVLVFDSF